MVVYNFKQITVVPSGKDFIDIALSKTQRKTPTVVHPGYAISRIRSFYIRKVKFSQQTFHDKLTQILEDFPLLDDIHPFYADLMNVLYDRDHYKLALSQLNTARGLIDNIGKDYVKLLKYGDSLYRCKQLKRAALGRMCTLMKKQSSSLAYLEQVRQHLSRLPSIDPNTRTIILCGYPNVGKSSFLNNVTRADVDVQPYPFTTKSLFVGHTDYKYLRWQIIDTPGILDHPLEQRNTIEMQSITALAHLHSVILFLVDISEQCGYSLKQQCSLFHSIKPLFTGKPILAVANKIDVVKIEDLGAEEKALLDGMGVEFVPMSNLTQEGITKVKEIACDRLLEQRVQMKIQGKKVDDVLNRLHLAVPKPRDNLERPPVIPPSVLEAKVKKESGMEVEEEKPMEEDPEAHLPEWLRGFNSVEWKKRYILKDDDWRFDVIPEFVDGKNIADFIDPEILERLDELEREEEEREEEMDDEDLPTLTEEQKATLQQIRTRRKLVALQHRQRIGTDNQPVIPRKKAPKTLDQFQDHLLEMGLNPSAALERIRARSRSRGRKRERSPDEDDEDMEMEESSKRRRSRSRSMSLSVVPGDGFKDVPHKLKAQKMDRKQQKVRNLEARKGEADRHVPTLRPKHLYSGKRGAGTSDRR